MTAPASSPSLPRRGRLGGQRRQEALWAIVFMLPWIIGFVVFTAGPMIASLFISFTRYNVIRPPSVIGLDNYERLLSDPRVAQSLMNTLYYTILNVPLSMIFALALALMLLRIGRAAGFFRTVFYLPALTPAVAVGVLFLMLLNGQTGFVNRGLGLLGIDGPNWTTHPDWIKPGIVIMSLWTLGSTTVIFFAALRNVPLEMYEAARIDGANAWQQFRNITLPFISGALFFTLIVNTIASLQLFSEVYTMFFGQQEGGSGSSSALFYVVYLFQKAFRDLDFGLASAMAWMLFLIVLGITIIQLRLSKRWEFYEGE